MAERPKMSSYREMMINNLSEIMGIDRARVNVKFTTTEKMGFVEGRRVWQLALRFCSMSWFRR
jgi:2-C-methyl-D-erythritol 4-phosphate cytidylyltransferase/2-C-methyl-D-erythritol 2,4-cyclodiphosphate synthase